MLQHQFPAPSEYDRYYAGYVACVEDPDIFMLLRRQQTTLCDLVHVLSDHPLESRYAPGKWTLKEVIGHLIDSERQFAYRALCIARSDPQKLPGFDQDDYVAAGFFNGRSLKSLLEESKSVREATIQLFENFEPHVWNHVGFANKVLFSVRAIAFVIVGHEAHHLKVIETRYLSG